MLSIPTISWKIKSTINVIKNQDEEDDEILIIDFILVLDGVLFALIHIALYN